MKHYFFTRKEISEELGIDPKTLRSKVQKVGIVLDKGLIPVGKVNEIKLGLQVKPGNHDDTEQIEQPDENFNKFDRSSLDSQKCNNPIPRCKRGHSFNGFLQSFLVAHY